MIIDINVERKTRKVIPKKRSIDRIENEMKIGGVGKEGIGGKALWSCKKRVADPI